MTETKSETLVAINARIDPADRAAMQAIAQREQTTFSQQLRKASRLYVNAYCKAHKTSPEKLVG